MSNEFWYLVTGGAAFYALLFWVDRRWGRALLNRDFNERERVMAASIMKSEQSYVRMESVIDTLNRQIKDKEDQLFAMRQQSVERDERINRLNDKIRKLEGEVAELERQLQEKKVIDKPPQRIHVLGIWPVAAGQTPLDQQSEADAMYNAGYEYTALKGARANRAGVVFEIDRVRPTIIQIGGHGNADGILLSDGIAEPGWWGEVVAGKSINLMVLLSCESSQQDEVNISDALIRVGVRAVISCDDKIDDKDAVRFAQLLYAKMSEGMFLDAAVRRARLAVSRKSGEMIRFRQTS